MRVTNIQAQIDREENMVVTKYKTMSYFSLTHCLEHLDIRRLDVTGTTSLFSSCD